MEKQKKSSFVQAGEKYLIRFPEGMRERLAEAAKANNRSMNAEIVARLMSTFPEDNGPMPPDTRRSAEDLLKGLERMLAEREDSMLERLRVLTMRGLANDDKKRGG